MRVTYFDRVTDTTTHKSGSISWDDLATLLTSHLHRDEKDGPGFAPVEFEPGPCACGREKCPGERGHRIKSQVRLIHALGFDVDKGTDGAPLTDTAAGVALKRLAAAGVGAAVHTTYSYQSPHNSTWRVFVPLSRPIRPDEFSGVWRGALEVLGLPSGIRTDNPARFWYLPSAPPGAQVRATTLQGPPLDVDRAKAACPVDTSTDQVFHDADSPPLDMEALRGAFEALMASGQATKGEGDPLLSFHALRELKNEWAVPWEQAKPMLEHWDSQNDPPWGIDRLTQKWESIDLDQNHGLFRAGYELAREFGSEKPLEAQADAVAEEIAGTSEGEYVEHLRRAALEWTETLGELAEQKVSEVRPMLMPASELLDKEFPREPWLVRGMLTEGGVCCIATEPKAGKTWLATYLSICLASGAPVFGEYQSKKSSVAYFYAEDSGNSVQNRTKALMQGIKTAETPDRLFLQPKGRTLNLLEDRDCVEILGSVSYWGGVDLIVLDPLRDFHMAAEDSSDEMAKLMQRIRALAQVSGAAVMFVHHTAKSSGDVNARRPGQRMRGSSVIHGALDCGIYLHSTAGDGKTEIENTIECEVKAGRSLGRKRVKLSIIDNEHGVSEVATYEISDDTGPAAEDEDVLSVVTAIGDVLIRGEAPPLAAEIAKLAKIPNSKIKNVIASAQGQGLVQPHVVLGLNMAQGWELTADGDAAFRKVRAR